ncbi:MAG: oxygen-independent coproporphyrinogen III oxidase [Rhodospirillaceae bacterium]|nr:oxygen-independent coproporphyrinogen III oxidase [Rhodospirillaceae bacterium]
MTPDLLARYARPVPRYTSYPTAPHFQAEIGAGRAASWLAALRPDARLSLYFHVPFCRSLCWFCGCHTKITHRDGPIDRYLDMLLAEMAIVARLAGGRRVAHIHFGGGSPSLLRPDDFRRLAEAWHRLFALEAGAEIAIEIDPRSFGADRIAALAEIGVNRASLGVQDFAPDVQRAINRIQPRETTQRVIDDLRAAGIGAINLDLMYGLPLQTVGGFAETVGQALALAPDRIALFGYAHVPWMKKHQALIDTAALPDPWQRWCQAEAAGRQLALSGYAPIGLDHFARRGDSLARAAAAGTLRRNFQGYTADPADALIGFGASAIGAQPDGYLQNETDLKAYAAAIAAGRLAIARGRALTADDRLRAAVIEKLMTVLTVDVGALCRGHGFDTAYLDDGLAQLHPLAADGLVTVQGRKVEIMPEARLLMRSAAACFDAYLAPTPQPRHAQAV